MLAAALAEGAARILVRRGTISYRVYRTTPEPTFTLDIDRAFGVWHLPGSSLRDRTPCWDLTYRANSYGARDVERSRRSTASSRHVVLGDSFIEGVGVADGERLSERLEAATGEEFLNFGVGGGFGTVQEMMQYRSLVSTFDHSDVLLFVLPLNDFVDNNPRLNDPGRYRPYLRRAGDGYEVFYPVRFEDRELGRLTPGERVFNGLSNALYTVNGARQIVEHRRLRYEVPYDWRSYQSFTSADVDVMAEAIRELSAAAGARPVHVFIIPVQMDLDSYNADKPFAFPSMLRTALAGAAQVDVTDLLPDFLAYGRRHQVPTSAFFASCDPHWSPLGDAVAAAAVGRHLGLR